MDNEPEEVIKHQMLETRASMAEKLETLEQQVVGTVHSATSAVTDTVESVKDAVQQTVQLAKASVHDTVEAVKDSLDLSRHVREHPWVMVGSSMTVGFAAGCLLAGSGRERPSAGDVSRPSAFTPRFRPQRDGELGPRVVEEARPESNGHGVAPQGLFGDLGQKFETEIHKLKGLALGTLLGAVRDVITSSAPPQLSSQLAEVIDSVTVKLGGQPIHGSVLNMFEPDSAERQESRQNHSSGERAPTRAGRNVPMHGASPID